MAQSQAFLGACERQIGHPIDHVISPVIEIVPVNDLPDLTPYATVMVTSQNAVDRAGSGLRGRTVVTVGQRTADKATALGAHATCLGENIEQFMDHLPSLKAPVIYLRGVHARADVEGAAKNAGIRLDETVVYDQRPKALDTAAKTLLASGSVVVPIFSPRTAALVSQYPVGADAIVLALSDTVAASWQGPGQVSVADFPTANELIKLIQNAF